MAHLLLRGKAEALIPDTVVDRGRLRGAQGKKAARSPPPAENIPASLFLALFPVPGGIVKQMFAPRQRFVFQHSGSRHILCPAAGIVRVGEKDIVPVAPLVPDLGKKPLKKQTGLVRRL